MPFTEDGPLIELLFGSQINEMPAFSVCGCCLIGENVITAMSIFHIRLTKAVFMGKQRRPGSVLQILLTVSALLTVSLLTVWISASLKTVKVN